ncbi:MAG: hypothetical protein ACTSO9_00825 [Candidatus Helarchaeota archaeon]
MVKKSSETAQYPWFTIIMKILIAIPTLLDFQFESMKIGPKCGARFFDNYSDE